MLRGVEAPNGTTELVLDLALRTIVDRRGVGDAGPDVLAGGDRVVAGAARAAASPLYDFDGLRRFRARLSPARWSTVWMVWDRGPAALVLVDVLRALRRRASGRLRHALDRGARQRPPWAVAMPLVPWIGPLVGLLATGPRRRAGALPRRARRLDCLRRRARVADVPRRARPRPRRLAALAIAAAIDAAWSVHHVANAGLGPSLPTAALRTVAVAGPIVGTIGLAWASRLADVVADWRILK